MSNTTMRVKFLPDGSVKLTIDGAVEAEIHDAVEADLQALAVQLGGKFEQTGHGHSHAHHTHHHHVIRIKR